MQAGLLFSQFIAHDECEIVEFDVAFGHKDRPVLFEVAGVAADLAVNTDIGALAVDQVHDVAAVAAERLAVVSGTDDLFECVQGILTGIAVGLKKMAVLSLDVLVHLGVLYFETEFLQNVGQMVCFGKSGHGNDDRLGVLGLGNALFFFHSGHGVEIVDSVGNLDKERLAVHLALQFGVREQIHLCLGQGVVGKVKVLVAQGSYRIYGVGDAGIEELFNFRHGDIAVFDHIMEQGCHDHVAFRPPFCYRTRCAQRVFDVRLAGAAGHACMHFLRKVIGALDAALIADFVVLAVNFHDIAEIYCQFVCHGAPPFCAVCSLVQAFDGCGLDGVIPLVVVGRP